MRTALKTTLWGVLLVLAISGWSSAQEYEYKDYTVKKGDTLWKISRAHLKDPFDWPMVWKENIRINNPDRIYPGQVIRIPIGRKKQSVLEAVPPVAGSPAPEAAAPAPVTPEVKTETAPAPVEKTVEAVEARKVPAFPAELVLSSGYISPEVPQKGSISGSLGKSLFGPGDEIYLNVAGTAEKVEKGRKYYVIRKGPKVYHPENKKLFLGYLIKISGIVEVIKADGETAEARVSNSFDDMVIGDMLDDYYEVEPVFLHEPPRAFPALKGVVVGARDMRNLSGLYDVVYIDKGTDDGLEPGDMLITVVPGTPDKTNAVLRVVGSRGNTSTAFVVESMGPILKGDTVIGTK